MNKIARFAAVAVLAAGTFQAIASSPSATPTPRDGKGGPTIPVPTCPYGPGACDGKSGK